MPWNCTCGFGKGLAEGAKCPFCKKYSLVVSEPLVKEEIKEEVEVIEAIAENVVVKATDVDFNKDRLISDDSTAKPVDVKKAELEAYKYYANILLPQLDVVIRSFGNDSEKILDELESRIRSYEKEQFMFKTFESTVRRKRADYVKEKNLGDVEKRRKKDLEYKPYVPGESEIQDKTKVKKTVKKVVTAGLSAKERLIADLVSKGLSELEAKKLIGG